MKGVATRIDPESCVGDRKGDGEALTGARVGQPLSREMRSLRSADAVEAGGRQHRARRYRKTRSSFARSETLACTDAPHTGTGRSCPRLRLTSQTASRSPKDVRRR
jgi:hypothetical protein